MQTPEELTQKLKDALGDNLRVVAVYGSAAVGDRTRKYSDVNLLVILERADSGALGKMAPLFKDWIKAGNKTPVILLENQLRASQDVFPLELSDIRDRHRILHGSGALIQGITVQPAHLRRQLEFELRSKLYLLRQAYLESAGRGGAIEDLLARLLSSVTALYRGILRLAGERIPASTPELLRAVEALVAIDAEAWGLVWRIRQGDKIPRGLAVDQLFDRLAAGLQNAINFVDAHSAS